MLLQALQARILGIPCKVIAEQTLQGRALLCQCAVTHAQGNIGAELAEQGRVVVCLHPWQVGGRGQHGSIAGPVRGGDGQAGQQGFGASAQHSLVEDRVIDAALVHRQSGLVEPLWLMLGQPALQFNPALKGHPGG
ncbi:hypothetical protein D3C85_606940 [compost metagenome]